MVFSGFRAVSGLFAMATLGMDYVHVEVEIYELIWPLLFSLSNHLPFFSKTVAVLDQEEAKKFLTGKEEDKYAFFTKATELERLDNTYASIQDNIEEQHDAKERAMQAIEGTRETAMRLKKEWEQFQELDKMESECQTLRANVGWAVHSEVSADLEGELKQRAKLQKNLEKRQGELAEAEKTVNVTDDEEAAANERLKELSEEGEEAAELKMQLERELKLLQQPLKKKEQDVKVIQKEVASAQKRLKSAQNRLERARQEVLDSMGNAAEEERQRTRKIAQLERDIADGRPKLDPLKERITEALNRYNELQAEVGPKTQLKQDTERTVSDLNVLCCLLKSLSHFMT
jgi:chromosome segregation ATPase